LHPGCLKLTGLIRFGSPTSRICVGLGRAVFEKRYRKELEGYSLDMADLAY
jgi:hypothetical protein